MCGRQYSCSMAVPSRPAVVAACHSFLLAGRACLLRLKHFSLLNRGIGGLSVLCLFPCTHSWHYRRVIRGSFANVFRRKTICYILKKCCSSILYSQKLLSLAR